MMPARSTSDSLEDLTKAAKAYDQAKATVDKISEALGKKLSADEAHELAEKKKQAEKDLKKAKKGSRRCLERNFTRHITNICGKSF